MKQDQDLRAIIASHEAELTDMERDIAQYFLSFEARQHPCPSCDGVTSTSQRQL